MFVFITMVVGDCKRVAVMFLQIAVAMATLIMIASAKMVCLNVAVVRMMVVATGAMKLMEMRVAMVTPMAK